MKPLEHLISLATAQVGTQEIGGNNTGPMIHEYQKATWLAPGPWSWCAAFQCWLMREWLKQPEVVKVLAVIPEKWRCRDASAFGWIKWAKDHGLYITDEKEQAKAGDIVVFDFSHIGIVTADQLPGKHYIETIEGNTNGKGERDSTAGDGVWRKTRSTNIVRNYIRLVK